jgi:hypothetical protein
MTNFIVGTIFGIAVSTIGFSGVAKIGDRAVDQTKVIIQESTK